MKTLIHKPGHGGEGGYAMLWVLLFSSVSMLVLGGAMDWTAQSASMTERNVDYSMALAAAEGASEAAVARIAHEFQVRGEGSVYRGLESFKKIVPGTNDHKFFGRYRFSNGGGNANQVHIIRTKPTQYVPLDSQYSGLSGMAATYRVVANATDTLSRGQVTAAVGQDVQVATVPIFQFAIFYSQDMEILNGPAMVVNGRVHGNANLYLAPNSSLTLNADVTAVGSINNSKHPLDPRSSNPSGSLYFNGQHDGGTSSMNLPIGTNNSPDAVYEVLLPPPVGELPNSAMGKERFYNKADIILEILPGAVVAKTGLNVNNFGSLLSSADWSVFAKTNVTFYNKREMTDVLATEIDVAKLRAWSATNTSVRPLIGRDVDTLYVYDRRSETNTITTVTSVTNWNFTTNTSFTTNITHRDEVKKKNLPPTLMIVPNTLEKYVLEFNKKGKPVYRYRFDQIDSIVTVNNISSNSVVTTTTTTITNSPGATQSGVRLVNGETLPSRGLTVATPNPLYIKGNFNVSKDGSSTTLGSHNTDNTNPASVAADAVTILSTAWNDANSTKGTSSRIAANTTVNTAILTGNVPSGTQGRYSGGVENFPRFLEEWSGKKLTYNGSLVCMFPSKVASTPWGGSDVYSPPARDWAYDQNFQDSSKLPPNTPQIRSLIRSEWASLAPNTQSF